MKMNMNEAIKQVVEAGLGLGVVSLHTVQAELAARHLCVLDVQGFPLRRQWYLVQRQGKRLSPAAQAFAQFVLSEAGRDDLRPRPATSIILGIEHSVHCATWRCQFSPKCDGAKT